MTLRDYSTVYAPVYNDLVELTVKHEKAHWFEHEAKLGVDIEQWKTGSITTAEKDLISNILRLFTQSDVSVGQGYYERIIPVIRNNEARNMLGSFAAREATHQRAYALLTDTLGFGSDFYWEFLNYHEMREKYEFLAAPVGDTTTDFAAYLAKQTLVEGVTLFASFVMLLNFDRLGKLPGMCDVVRWSMIDESLHIEGNCALYRIFLRENPEIERDVLGAQVRQLARDLVRLEDAFIDRAFQLGGTSNLDPEAVKTYVRYVADYRLGQLGYQPVFQVTAHPLPWIDHLMGRQLANFFERAVVEYEKETLTGSFAGTYPTV